MLFPVTAHIPGVCDWSVDGIISYANSKPALKVFSRKVHFYLCQLFCVLMFAGSVILSVSGINFPNLDANA